VHDIQHELPENQDNATIEKAYSTILKYRRYLKRWALPRAPAKLGVKRTTLIAIVRRLDISRPIHQEGTDERGIAREDAQI
jgi:hypothetical protein